MSDDLLERRGSQLRGGLRTASVSPPPVAALRRRRTVRRALNGVGAVTVVVAALVVVPQLLGTDDEITIDPVGPTEEPDVAPDDDEGSPRDGDGADETAEGVEVDHLDVEVAVPIRVLAARFNDPSLGVIDLDPGELAHYPPGAHRLSGDAIGGALVLSDGTIVVWQDDEVRVFNDGLGNDPLVHRPVELINPPDAAPAFRVVPSADEQALWIVQVGPCCGDDDAREGLAELVDLRTGEVQVTATLPPSSFPAATTPSGLLLNTRGWHRTDDSSVGSGAGGAADGRREAEPGSERALFVDAEGTVSDLIDGEVVAADGETAAVHRCGTDALEAGCRLELVDLPSGEVRERVEPPVQGAWSTVNLPEVPGDHAPWNPVSTDGRLLLAAGAHLVTVDLESGNAEVVHRVDGSVPPAAWDRRGERIVLADGTDLVVLDPSDGSTFTLHDVIPAEHFVIAIG